MKQQQVSRNGASLLLLSAPVEERRGTDMPVLHLPGGPILLSESAAAILRLCNGRHRRGDIHLRVRTLGYRLSADQLDAFLDAALARKWIVEFRPPVARSSQVSVCAEY